MPAPNAERAANVLELWRDNPGLFAREVFPRPLRRAQEEVLEALAHPDARRVAVLAPRGWGKTAVETAAALWWCATRGPDALVLVACPSERQVLTWFSELNRQFYASRLTALFPEWTPLNTSMITGRAGWGIRGQSSDSPALQEGAHADRFLLVIDESKALPDDHFTALAGGCASSTEWRILAAGTGGAPAGWWYRAFHMERDFWRTFIFRPDDESCVHLREVIDAERARLRSDHPQFRSLYGVEFVADSEYSPFESPSLERARGRDPWAKVFAVPMGTPEKRVVLGCDPARGAGGDDAALAVVKVWLDACQVESITVLPSGDEMSVAAGLAAEAYRHGAAVVAVESGGLGHSIFARTRDLLRDGGISVHSYNGSTKALRDESCANRKAEIAMRLRVMLLENRIGLPTGPTFDRLARELLGLRVVQTPTGQIRIADPPSKSPDFADAVLAALAGAFRPLSFVALPRLRGM